MFILVFKKYVFTPIFSLINDIRSLILLFIFILVMSFLLD